MDEHDNHDDHPRDEAARRHHGHQPERRQRGVYHYHRQRGWQPHPHGHAARRRLEERPSTVGETGGVGLESVPTHQYQHRVSARHLALPRGTAPLVERGTIATYDPVGGTAMVRLAGAPARLVGPVRVTACAPRDLAVAGSACLVVLLDPYNPADGVVAALWPAPGAASVKLTQAGVAAIGVGGGSAASVAVSFPTPYAAPPVVVATPADPARPASVGDITASGFTLTVRAVSATTGTGTVAAQWLACGV